MIEVLEHLELGADEILLRVDPTALADFPSSHPADFPAPPFAVASGRIGVSFTSATATTPDLQIINQQILRMNGSGPEGQACFQQGGASKQSNSGVSAPLAKPKHVLVAKTEHGKDAGSVNSTAIRATEDTAARRFAAVKAESEPTDRTRASKTQGEQD